MTAKSFVAVLLVSVGAWSRVPAQATGSQTVLSVFRDQAASISEDVLRAIGPPYPLSVRLSVEEAPLPAAVEYAFLERFSARGVSLRGAEASMDYSNHLMVLILEQRVRYDSLSSGHYLRTVQTALEGRFSPGDGAPVRYLGSFQRMNVDSVAAMEEIPWSRSIDDSAEGSSTFSRIIAPLVIITGAALIVYLFFAVRSS
jgi:hypothetical protein